MAVEVTAADMWAGMAAMGGCVCVWCVLVVSTCLGVAMRLRREKSADRGLRPAAAAFGAAFGRPRASPAGTRGRTALT